MYLKLLIRTSLIFCLLTSCHEDLREKAYNQAKDYTRKYCPTPVHNYCRTDSIVFDKKRCVYTYYVSFFDELDNIEIIEENKKKIEDMLQQSIKESTSLKGFLDAGFKFEYICHSGSDPDRILIRTGL